MITRYPAPRRAVRQRGFTLITIALSLVAFLSILALAIDLGRVYIAKNETQAFADSASLEGTLELDGTVEGITRAQSKILSNDNRWNFSQETIPSVTIAFAQSKAGPWDGVVVDPRNYKYVRVVAQVPVPQLFYQAAFGGDSAPPAMLLLGGGRTLNVTADSRSGQEIRTIFKEGLFPFSPFAHNNVAPHFGLNVGSRYTLRWAAAPRFNSDNVCEGDNIRSIIDLAEAGGGSERGYIEETSASVIRDTIVYNYQSIQRVIGESVIMTGGSKQTILDALIERVNQDTDPQAATFTDYVLRNVGNGRRLVGVPINTGYPDYRIVQIGGFFLSRPQEYNQGGNKPFCAEYVGAWLLGGKHKAVDVTGAFVARLVR